MKDSLEYENGRYRVAVPWKDDKPELPDTKPMALSRLRSTERNLKKDNRGAEEYKATIQAYVEKGCLRKVPSDEQLPNNVWYLPHFPVVRVDKATTKVRIVFDCAAKCNGISLNDMIHAGPKLLQGFFNVLVRFRRNSVGITCDIKEMYLQIEVKEQDQSHFRLLWRDLHPNREPDVFEFNRLVFGKNSAPMESQFVAQEDSRRNQDRYPLAAETVLKSTYMDDSIDSVENDEEGVESYRQLKAPWGAANMQARKWISNSPEVVEKIPAEERATEIVIDSGQDPITKTLGISWSSTKDEFTVTASPVSPGFQTTKRNILRKIATIYDPLGFVCPYVVVVKILLQELWIRRYGCDDEVQDEIADLCTRGATPSELADSPLWWNGPDWLTKDFKEWSKMQDPNRPREMPEKKTSQRKEDTNGCTTLLTNNLQKEAASKQDDKLGVWRLDPKRFSSWIRLLRVHARVRRVLLNMRRRDNRNARMELLPEEIKDAEEEIVRLAQREGFCEEYTALRSGKPISKKSQLIKLNPYIDVDGIIRCDGRLKFADFLPYDTRFPILLPRGHWVTKLIVKNYHERGNHAAGVNFTLCQLSERFWIIAARGSRVGS